jgi:hypothetical protein
VCKRGIDRIAEPMERGEAYALIEVEHQARRSYATADSLPPVRNRNAIEVRLCSAVSGPLPPMAASATHGCERLQPTKIRHHPD